MSATPKPRKMGHLVLMVRDIRLDAFDQCHFKRFVVPPPDWGPRK